jgi:uncharacterized protein YbbC (DUF1343 family)
MPVHCTVSFSLIEVAKFPITQLALLDRLLLEELLVSKLMRRIDRFVQQFLKCLLVLPWLVFFPDHMSAGLQQTCVLTGIDVLEAESFARLAGKRVGLITNHTGVNRLGKSDIDLFLNAPGVRLVALFSPEHGLLGNVDRKVTSGVDQRTGLPVYSLYGETRRPTPEMLQGIDILVFDIQDIGVRFYTYITTMAYAMEEAAKAGIRFMVLDRPNPLNGIDVEGPILESQRLSFTGYFPLPVRHGMSVGELARLFNAENNMGADLEIVNMEGWRREYWYDQTDLPWINPSPNIRNLREAVLYPAIGLLESTNLSVGRGTDVPFELLGAPWINASRLSRALNRQKVAGIKFNPIHFTPTSDRYKGKRCHGVKITVLDRDSLRSVTCGLETARILACLYPRQFQSQKLVSMVGMEEVVEGVSRGTSSLELFKIYEGRLRAFLSLRDKYLLYL